ncbi:MAG TPA: 5-oxoprolinase subunit PxpB [Candidatus Marinimicrobia bacterium]|nr:allophanate hydrolase [Candidatus Neomarinimicrobiota bacterium]MDP6276066.1 5-oxoprolinase subunit PxpB [Candidatus Neomarinimicrobiota bacterium]MDP7436830.1 5-oxoprolinase subunit PxpB [Candidatus Neomarinimicrobiota bacterium]MDP7653512.1 5-oxoprolinase subunit PxpB [Candidatus Neomarinimicrobiota bacterium]HJL74799.1 5-oxoprolinase subunit PxpB [Candidatus Neomarinimicrobiota bacterium]
MTIPTDPTITPASDRTLLLHFGEDHSPEIQEAVFQLSHYLLNNSMEGILNIHPGYRSVMVTVDVEKKSIQAVQKNLQQVLKNARAMELPEPSVVDIPVLYGGQHGPDINKVAEHTGLSTEKVIALHSSGDFQVSFIGFTPGFPYISGMDEKLATPRLQNPRKRVPAGSIGIAGNQTGIYPSSTPGGWNLIGRTPLHIFDIQHPEKALLKMGDRITFKPITESEFERWQQT